VADAPAGLVVVDKPGGMTSHDVVGRVRRIAGTRKVGHAGTLDPMATGVLVLGVGRATRLLGHLLLTDKAYAATARLGATTTTDDAEGDLVTQTVASHLTQRDVRAALSRFTGRIDQVPSSVSAVKVEGRRAYARVRAGESVDLPARAVQVHELEATDVRTVGDHLDVDLTVRCSSGTYVRALARDLGSALGVGGHLTALRRTAVGRFDLADARTLDDLAASFVLLGMDEVAARCFPTCTLSTAQAEDVRFGRRLELDLGPAAATGAPVAMLTDEGRFLALYEQRGSVAAAVAVFVG